MATPPQNNDNIRINAPLNFRHTDTLITTKVPHYPTKVDTGMSIIPGWTRPNANGQNANINDKDYNGPNFKARPLKHWRKQLQVYNYNGPANNSRTATISELERPGTTVYHFTPDCTCVAGEGGNSYIISNNQFGYETKDDDYTKVTDTKIQNNGFTVVPYDATAEQIRDPIYPAYRILTGVYNTNCINCSPQGNLIRSGIAFQNQAYYSYSKDKLESRCQTYEQNISTNKALGCVYFDAQGIPLWPNDTPNGPQVVAPVNYGSTIDNGTFFNLYEYGYNLSTLGPASQVNSASFTPKVTCNPKYVIAGFYVNIAPAALIEATIYNSSNSFICKSINTQYSYVNTNPPFVPSTFNLAARIFYFPQTTFIDPSTSYYITFKTINSVNFAWLLENFTTNNLSGTLVAEPLRCLSQTIYKPSNVAFAKQGAVSGATRLKKLVSDTITMNGSSFYSAKGAEEANVGRYQGTNISGNYYVKIKPVIDSCLGTTPTPPILSVIDNDTYSITFTWQEAGSSTCKIVYYTITYYAINIVETFRDIDNSQYFFNTSESVEDIQDFLDDNYNEIVLHKNNNTETMVMSIKNGIVNSNTIYTDRDNRIRYNIISEIRTIDVAPNTTSPPNIQSISQITSLNSNTNYLMSMTSTNGNGTSIRSNVILSSTLFDSNIVISIEPVTIELSGDNYVYPYNSYTPIVLTVKVSSDHKTTPIILSIINASNSNLVTMTPVEGSPDTYEIRLDNSGTFNLQGRQARGLGELNSKFGNSIKTSPLLTITKATPVFSTPWDISKSSILLIGKTYPFFPLKFLSPLIQLYGQYKIINIDGTESNNATFINSDGVESNTANFTDNFGENGSKILVKSYGTYGILRVKATSIETQNYKSISTTSDNIYASRNDPIIKFTFPNVESFDRKFTYRAGQTYDIEEINSARIISPAEPQSDVRITYSAISPETDTTSDVASIDARTVTIMNAGSFRIRARTNQTGVYNIVEAISPLITIDKATPIFAGPWYLFPDINSVVFVGRTYSFNPPVFEYPYPGPSFPSASISITSYTSSSTVARLIGSTTTIRIDSEGLFTITAKTTESRNYKQVEITSEEQEPTFNTARVIFPINFITNITYGDEYVLKEADFIYPRDTINFEEGALLSGSRIIVSIEQYNYFIIGRRVTADIVSVQGSSPPPISRIDDTITDKKIEYDILNRVSRHVIYIRNDTGISASTPASITNIIQYISNPRDFNITYSVVSDTGSASDVASISGTKVTLIKAGNFKIRAVTNQINPASTIMNYTRDSPLITVRKATPVLRFNDLFEYTLQVGNTYSFNKASIDRPVNIPSEILPITYISLNPDIVTIVNRQPTASETPSIRINIVGGFRIRAETKPSDRYNIGFIESPEEFSTNPGMPLIKFHQSQNFGPFTYRDTPFNIKEVIFLNPIERHEEIEVRYSIVETNIASIEDRTVTINSAGEFTLRVKTIPTANFTTSNILYKNIIIQKYTPQFEEGWVAFINTNNVNYLIVGQTFEINPPKFISPDPNLEDTFPYDLRSIQYTIEPERRAEIFSISETSTVIKVIEEGGFYIYARTNENSINYNIVEAKSRIIYGTTQERPIIEFSNNNEIIEITYGDDYSLDEIAFVYPEPIINIKGTATLSITSTGTRIILQENLQYNAIVIGAYLRVTTTSSNIVNFIVINRMIQTGAFIVVVELITGETLPVKNYTIQNMTQEMRIPVGGSIAYSIVPPPVPTPPSYVEFGPVATISETNVTIRRTGSFIVQAIATITNVPPTFRYSSYPIFSTINVKRATPTVLFDNNNLFPDQVLLTGRRYNFTPAVVTIPSSVTHEELEIEYRSDPQGVVTIFPRDMLSNTIPIRVNRAVMFRIIAQTLEPPSGNFNRSVPVYSSNIYGTEINTPVLFFPGVTDENGEIPVTNLTYDFINSNGVRNIYNVEQLAEFRYPYPNNIPSDLKPKYRINDDSSNIATVEMRDIIVDSEILGTNTISAPVITILRAGEFTLIAETIAGKFTLIGGTEPTVEFRGSQPIYRKFNVQKATATFEPWYLFPIDNPDDPLLAGQRRNFTPPVFITPNPIPPQINPSKFTYKSSVSLIASVETSIVNGSKVLTAIINKVGQFQIVASIPETDNYTAIRVYSENQYSTNINRPLIRFPTNPPPTTVITYGETYTLSPAYFYYPRLSIREESGLNITHFVRSTRSPDGVISTHAEVNPGISPNYIETVKILSAGTFYIVAQTNIISNVFEKTYISLNVTVNPATPTISFPGTIFPNQDVLIVGTSYDFLPAVVTIPSGVTDSLPQIRYKTNDADIATIRTVVTLEGAITKRITILRPSTEPIQIIAYTEATTNFTAAQAVYSNQRSSYYNIPLITAPYINGISNNTLTFGQVPIPTLQRAVVQNPRPNTFFHSSISIEHISSNTNVATINGTTITLLKYGTFKIIAKTVETAIFRSVSRYTQTVTVNRGSPTFNALWNPIPPVLFIGDVANITPPVFTFPAAPVPPEIFPITYSYTTAGIITITPTQPTLLATSVIINNIGRFRIRATTRQSDRYKSVFIDSQLETVTNRRTPVIAFPPTPTFSNQVIFGGTYSLSEATFNFPSGTPNPGDNGVTISYSIVNSSRTDVAVATSSGIRGTTITINNTGFFYIRATTNATTLFNSVSQDSVRVTVIPATPIFQTTPWNAFPNNTVNVPIGTQLTITPPQITFPSALLQQQNRFSIVYVVGNAVIIGQRLSVEVQGAGQFTIRAETRSSTNYTVASITSVHTITAFNPIPPRIVLQGETLVFQESSIPTSPTFIQASPRGVEEWFAVVNDNSRIAITNYARGTDTTTFRSTPTNINTRVPFNNIVTTLMTDMNSLFFNTPNFNQPISSWDTRNVLWMQSMFSGSINFNQPIGRWNTSRVRSMHSMFVNCSNFNQDISNWNTSQVTDMSQMFRGASQFRSSIANWNTGNVTNMSTMFQSATAFNSPLLWNTSQVTHMMNMFEQANSFNQNLNWNTSRVQFMNRMFATPSFNGNISNFDTSSVITMNTMFTNAGAFNQDITRWNTSRVADMSQMFDGARNFNQPIGGWNTGAVITMSWMFRNAQQFNQNIGAWNTSRVTDMQHMFDSAQRFNNGNVVQWNFNGFLSQVESNQFFIRNIPSFSSIPFSNNRLNIFNSYWMLITPRQTMNWNTVNVRNMNNMFNETPNFFNVDLRRWQISNDTTTVRFRNFSAMSDQFTPLLVGVLRPGAGFT